jgi:uncharacterized protein
MTSREMPRKGAYHDAPHPLGLARNRDGGVTMEWKGRRGSGNIEDRRSSGGGRTAGVGGIGAILLLLAGWYFNVDVSGFIGGGAPAGQSGGGEITAADKAAGEFVSVTLADTEEIWSKVFQEQLGRKYTPATLVLYKGVTQSPCGNASGASGPFYCPGDKKVYLDTEFFTTLEQQLGASGDFADAYVVAHEVGHHVQDELGILSKANAQREQVSTEESNAISVQIELQADCFSGIWARDVAQTFGTIDRADLEEAINAAKQIGDDTLQRNAGQRVSPESFTHGTSEQRSGWFMRGLKSGKIADCNTFSG